MRLPFAKLSGAGNDFILLKSARLPGGLSGPALARRLCPRRSSVGADGLLVARRGPAGARELEYYNADGSRAFCANGCRAAAWWMRRAGWAGSLLELQTSRGPVQARAGAASAAVRLPDASVRLGLRLDLGSRSLRADFADTGAPHAVVWVPAARLDGWPVVEAGRALRRHRAFAPAGANADFAALSGGRLRLRTYERGVEDETLACGTGAAAAAVAAAARGRLRSPARVRVESGDTLTVRFQRRADGAFTDVWLEGPVRLVYQGEIEL